MSGEERKRNMVREQRNSLWREVPFGLAGGDCSRLYIPGTGLAGLSYPVKHCRGRNGVRYWYARSRCRQERERNFQKRGDSMSRIDELLREAADAFEDGRDPFSTVWLRDHDVSSTECVNLGERIADVLRGYLNAPMVVRELFPFWASDEISAAEREHIFHGHYGLSALRSAGEHSTEAKEGEAGTPSSAEEQRE